GGLSPGHRLDVGHGALRIRRPKLQILQASDRRLTSFPKSVTERGRRLRIMANNPRYRVTIYGPEPRTVPAGAQDALAHALGAAARLLLETASRVTIEATDDGKFYFYENSENSKGTCL